MKTVGVIGGSGLYEIDGLENIEYKEVNTPWGEPSDRFVTGFLKDIRMFFLPRHGRGHRIMPTNINYRANIYAMKMLGVERIISVSAVGSMKEEIEPGDVVIPNQFIDFTKLRTQSFFGEGIVAHVSMADPVCPELSATLYSIVNKIGRKVHNGGTYICIEGPQFSSKAESRLFRTWGVDVIGMTNMPEARLAREAEICYATLALSTDYDCWNTEHGDVSVEDMLSILKKNTDLAREVIRQSVNHIKSVRDCICPESLRNSIITSPDSITPEIMNKYGALTGKYLK